MAMPFASCTGGWHERGIVLPAGARNDGHRVATFRGSPSLLLRGLARFLDRFDGGELNVVKLAVLLLDFADIYVLHDVARLWIDRDRATRALPAHALYGLDKRVAVGPAAGFLERLVDQVHAVISPDRHEVRPQAAVCLLECHDGSLV